MLGIELQEPKQAEDLFISIKNEYEKIDNSEFQSFIQKGITFDKFTQEKTCPFCFRTLDNLFQNFVNYFNAKVKDHQQELEKLKSEIIAQRHSREQFIMRIPTLDLFFDKNQSIIKQLTQDIINIQTQIITDEQTICENLDQKIKNPYIPINLNYHNNDNYLVELQQKYQELKNIIDEHNVRVNNFEKKRTEASNWIKAYLLVKPKKEIQQLEKQKIDAKIKKEQHQEQLKIINNSIVELDNDLLNYKKPIAEYNRNIISLLGRTDIALDFDETKKGYVLKRNDRVVEWKTFSEGEKTAITLLHFLLSLKDESNGKHISNCIVVIDDPVSQV